MNRLKENVVFSIKSTFLTSDEFLKFYEDFDVAVRSLRVSFKPSNKVVKEIFIAKIKP